MKTGFLAFFIFFISFQVQAQSAQATFDEANTHLEQGEISRAMQLYGSIEQSGNISGALFLNMGITALQLDSLGLAKYYFLKASQFDGTKTDANQALDFVNAQFGRQSATLPKLPWDNVVEWLIEKIGAFGLSIISIIILSAGLILLVLNWFNIVEADRSRWYIITLLLCGFILTGLSFYVDYVDRRYQNAVMVASSGRVLQSPQKESALVSIAYEGYVITVDNW